MSDELKRALSYEYGRLDATYGLGYSPRWIGFEKEYSAGFSSAHYFQPEEIPPGSYTHKVNWGNY